MTGLLEEALRRLESLPVEQQHTIAALIIEPLDDQAAWDRDSRHKPDSLRTGDEYQRAYEKWKTISPVPKAGATKRMSRDETHERG